MISSYRSKSKQAIWTCINEQLDKKCDKFFKAYDMKPQSPKQYGLVQLPVIW